MKNRNMIFTTLLLALAFFGLSSPKAFGVFPAPDGGYPGGNTAEGQNALLNLTTGAYNTGVGIFSLLSLSDGNFCTGVGAGTLLANAASENTATGAGALLSNTIGDQNTANGAFTLFTNTEGIRNTAIGSRVLIINTGDSNTAIGADTLGANTIGAFNVAIGGSALLNNSAGVSNTAIGVGALSIVTGDSNTAVGRVAGFGITTGNNIIAIGSVEGLSTTNGQVDDSCYIDNIVDAGVDAGTAQLVFVDQDGKLGTTALPNTGTLQNAHALSGRVQELEATVARQTKAMEVLTAHLEEQAAQIHRVSAQLDATKPAPQIVLNNP